MEPTKQAILGRFNGNRTQAICYCYELADRYPRLTSEYMRLAYVFGGPDPKEA